MRRIAAFALAGALALYALLFAGVWLLQRSFLYFPSAYAAEPEAGIDVVRIRTEDGEILRAWWRAPASADAPVFLYFDGNAGAPQQWGARWREIAAKGAGFLAVSYRGYSGSTGAPSEAGLNADALAGYDWLIARGVSADRIVIHGFSLGSGVAARLAAEREARAVILEAPFTSIPDVAQRMAPFLPMDWVLADQFRTRDVIARVRAPVLIVHGARDTLIPVEMGEALYRLARAAKRFVAMPEGGHATLVRDGLYPVVWDFLGREAAR